ncbi:four-carbon acid sugar kinase family protein [Maribacter chungangensis]|uniref:Four-carbon acid sugar kinase family protein n=1 Tax=Maribacter chungangensis TaxID=1069117 RepID=A0ABW3AZQ4_9FLAO
MSDHVILKSIANGNQLKGYQKEIQELLARTQKTIVILDDDPTGTQTVRDIPVVTQWTETVLEKELARSPVFFILTNSRSLQVKEAENLAFRLGKRLQKIAAKHQKQLLVISRGDSTLRGHYPGEVLSLAEGLGQPDAKHVLIPAFFEGGRYTYQDVHYVQEGDRFVPAGETSFAKDSTFGYTASNLKKYIVEKYENNIEELQIQAISLDDVRNAPAAQITAQVKEGTHSHILVNATAQADLEKFALATLRSKKPLMYRTAASFVNAIIGQRPSPLLTKKDLVKENITHGALVIVGSYVPKTTAQLNYLKKQYKAQYVELDVQQLFEDDTLENTLNALATKLDNQLRNGMNVVLYTSRKLKKGNSKEESLKIVNLVSNALTTIASLVQVRPKFILAKGGITSSDIAVKSLGISRAMVLGQVHKGVPVWQADEHSRFPSLPYIVFPGNVGDDSALLTVLKLME